MINFTAFKMVDVGTIVGWIFPANLVLAEVERWLSNFFVLMLCFPYSLQQSQCTYFVSNWCSVKTLQPCLPMPFLSLFQFWPSTSKNNLRTLRILKYNLQDKQERHNISVVLDLGSVTAFCVFKPYILRSKISKSYATLLQPYEWCLKRFFGTS